MNKKYYSHSAPMHSGLTSSARKAGIGITYDDYSDDYTDDGSAPMPCGCKLPHDGITEEMWKSLNGEVVVVQPGKKRD